MSSGVTLSPVLPPSNCVNLAPDATALDLGLLICEMGTRTGRHRVGYSSVAPGGSSPRGGGDAGVDVC